LQNITVATVAAQRGQILIYRSQAQEEVVGRAVRQLDGARSKLADTQSNQKNLADQIKRMEEAQSGTQNPTDRKEIEDALPRLKAKLEMLGGEEQQDQAEETEGEAQLQMEQAKVSELHDQLDQLEKTLENSSRELGSIPR
jgi:chromosome segregation ATPase